MAGLVLTAEELEAYLARVRYDGPRPLGPSLAVLAALHRAHACAVPYEVLDFFVPVAHGGLRASPLETRLPRDDLAAQVELIVRQRRGGGCAPQNVLFAAALNAVGFVGVETYAGIGLLEDALAHRKPGETALPREGHMVVVVVCEGRRYLCDLGSPADGLTEPVELVLDVLQPVARKPGVAFSLRRLPEDAAYTELRMHRAWPAPGGQVVRCLAFRPILRDFQYVAEQAFCGPDPVPLGESLLRDHVLVARHRPDGGNDVLIDNRLKRRGPGDSKAERTVLATPQEFRAALRDVFDLDLAPELLGFVEAVVFPPGSGGGAQSHEATARL